MRTHALPANRQPDLRAVDAVLERRVRRRLLGHPAERAAARTGQDEKREGVRGIAAAPAVSARPAERGRRGHPRQPHAGKRGRGPGPGRPAPPDAGPDAPDGARLDEGAGRPDDQEVQLGRPRRDALPGRQGRGHRVRQGRRADRDQGSPQRAHHGRVREQVGAEHHRHEILLGRPDEGLPHGGDRPAEERDQGGLGSAPLLHGRRGPVRLQQGRGQGCKLHAEDHDQGRPDDQVRPVGHQVLHGGRGQEADLHRRSFVQQARQGRRPGDELQGNHRERRRARGQDERDVLQDAVHAPGRRDGRLHHLRQAGRHRSDGLPREQRDGRPRDQPRLDRGAAAQRQHGRTGPHPSGRAAGILGQPERDGLRALGPGRRRGRRHQLQERGRLREQVQGLELQVRIQRVWVGEELLGSGRGRDERRLLGFPDHEHEIQQGRAALRVLQHPPRPLGRPQGPQRDQDQPQRHFRRRHAGGRGGNEHHQRARRAVEPFLGHRGKHLQGDQRGPAPDFLARGDHVFEQALLRQPDGPGHRESDEDRHDEGHLLPIQRQGPPDGGLRIQHQQDHRRDQRPNGAAERDAERHRLRHHRGPRAGLHGARRDDRVRVVLLQRVQRQAGAHARHQRDGDGKLGSLHVQPGRLRDGRHGRFDLDPLRVPRRQAGDHQPVHLAHRVCGGGRAGQGHLYL